ncbi:DUF6115 domain-containing protein [Rossellomorea marisflavi]|uniref:DUF6115 domain-containing protein n=1 Tax=Rossellomorea TaxID=2837508 RepID=UPI00064FE07D|nr:hypothetical protein [Rossellomorea marisflavi]KML06467.1 hypothetical protein VL06_10260 [Rossellomorea marisflavi]KML32854.1 hypothetical protein VL12_13715 [Rossellomorea marisflavi]QHA36170.1 hypothetical protein D5E69_10265 [Rossellomorea marisflavi]TYO72337.1 hypothetical protein DQ398_001189 [Rossellomorea marisflavi]
MMFLIVLSILLNLVALFAIILLYVRQNRLLALDSQQKRRVTEMEELMSAYMAELKEENDTFLRSLANDVPADVESVTEPPSMVRKKAMDAYQSAPSIDPTDQSDAAEPDIVRMYRAGVSIDEIARASGVGKTEVELFLKFNRDTE